MIVVILDRRERGLYELHEDFSGEFLVVTCDADSFFDFGRTLDKESFKEAAKQDGWIRRMVSSHSEVTLLCLSGKGQDCSQYSSE